MRIFLDPGHGGSDSGEAANGILEKNVNLSVALKLKPLLLAQGIEAKLSREDDSFPSLNSRPAMANSWGADFFMSIHHNGGGGVGYEIYKGISGSCNDVAAKIATEYEKLGRKPHGGGVQTKKGSDGHDYFAVIRDTNMPALLSEFAYLDSVDVNAINSDVGQVAEAQAIASGIFAHLGIKSAQVTQTPIQPVNIVAAVAPLSTLSKHLEVDVCGIKTISIAGWATDPSGVSRIDIYADSKFITTTYTGVARPDVVAALHSDDAANSGYACDIMLSALPQGVKEISVALVPKDGSTAEWKTVKFNG